jgi:hypothetical protein
MQEQAVAEAILRLLRARAPGKSICPSEAARAVDAEAWRGLMPLVRNVVAQLSERGEIVITQRERPVGAHAKGAIRLRLP